MKTTDDLEEQLTRLYQQLPTPVSNVPPALDLDPRRPARLQPVLASLAVAVFVLGLAFAFHQFGLLAKRSPAASSNPNSNAAVSPALSLASMNGKEIWVVRRYLDLSRETGLAQSPENILYMSSDGGRSWQQRLGFNRGYDGMSWAADGKHGVLWTIEWSPSGCNATASSGSCDKPASYSLTVYATSDGGAHWDKRPSTAWPAEFVFFRGEEGWVASSSPTSRASDQPIYWTPDGGLSWKQVGSLPAQLGTWGHTSGVHENLFGFANRKVGWLATGSISTGNDSGFYMTRDGGRTWSALPTSALHTASTPNSRGLIAGYPELASDGGLLLPVSFGHSTDPVYGQDPNHFVTEARYIFTSRDLGNTWIEPRLWKAGSVVPVGSQYMQFFLDSKHWWFTTNNDHPADNPVPNPHQGLGRTTDGGETWQIFPAPPIIQMMFTDSDNGWAEAVKGPDNTNILLKTSDGAAHWQEVSVP